MGIQEHRTVPQLFTEVVEQVTSLFRTEMRLARAEMSEKMGKVGGAIGMIATGAILLIPALVILLQASVAALIDNGFEPHWAALIVGGSALLLGLILSLIGVSALKSINLAPNRTIEQLQSDAAVARNQVR